jgi:hypothetical protein
LIGKWLEVRGYKFVPSGSGVRFDEMLPGTFSFHINVPANLEEDGGGKVNISIDAVIKRKGAQKQDLPLMIEAKSAGDFTNVNKRRKEEAAKMEQLRRTFGKKLEYVLFLCGYFDPGYLGYEASAGIDWVWEHRIDDLTDFGL